MTHSTGYVQRPEARVQMLAGVYGTVSAAAELPPAWSNTRHRRRKLEQGQAGTCWLHSVTQMIEYTGMALGYPMFDVCRRVLGYYGKQLEGGGNPSNGGDPTDAILAATSEKGKGIAHESLCPYSDSSWTLGTAPPQSVLSDAQGCHLTMPVDVRSDDDSRRLIAAGLNVCNGIWWTPSWDSNQTFMTDIGHGSYGHSLLECGYVMPGVWDSYDYFQLDNWHGPLYPPLHPELAAKVPGYRPLSDTATSDFWVRGETYRRVMGFGNLVRVSATDLTGLQKKVVVPSAVGSWTF